MSTSRKPAAAAPAELPLDNDEDGAGPMPASTHPSLAHALLQAQRNIAHGVAKSGTAQVETRAGGSFSYKYASGEDMMAGAREALLSVGLLWTLESYEVDEPDDPQDLAIFRPTYLLEHPDSGESRSYTFPMPISMAGAADKALAGARTYTASYALRDVLLIPRPDANEPDKRRNDDDVGSWRGRTGRAKGREADAPAGPSSERRNPKAIANAEMLAAFQELNAASRARSVELTFAKTYRECMGKTWPGTDKAEPDDMLKAAVEFKRRRVLLDEATDAGPDDDENLGDSRTAMDSDEGDRS